MDFKEENIDRLFREGLKDFEVAPPSGVWEGVMQARTHKRKGVLPIFRYAAAAVAMLLVVGSLYTIINKPNLQKDTPQPAQSITPTIKDDIKSVEKVVQENVDVEKPLIAETQINIVKPESVDISSDKVLQTREPVNIRNETNVFLLAENYHQIEPKKPLFFRGWQINNPQFEDCF